MNLLQGSTSFRSLFGCALMPSFSYLRKVVLFKLQQSSQAWRKETKEELYFGQKLCHKITNTRWTRVKTPLDPQPCLNSDRLCLQKSNIRQIYANDHVYILNSIRWLEGEKNTMDASSAFWLWDEPPSVHSDQNVLRTKDADVQYVWLHKLLPPPLHYRPRRFPVTARPVTVMMPMTRYMWIIEMQRWRLWAILYEERLKNSLVFSEKTFNYY